MASQPASVAGDKSLEPLKAWIAEQEDYQRQHGRMPPLTDEQRRALAVLVPKPSAPAAKTSDDNDKDIGDTDWISLLMRYTQTHKAVHMPPKYDEEQVSRAYSNSPLWRYRCQIREAPDRWFPDIPKDGTAGSARSDKGLYVRKKEARQYAARTACKWLMDHHYMPSDGKSVTFPLGVTRLPVQAAPAAAPPKAAQSQSQPQPQSQSQATKRPYSEVSPTSAKATPGKQGRPNLYAPPPMTPTNSQAASLPLSPSSLSNVQQQQQQQQQQKQQQQQQKQQQSLQEQQTPLPFSTSLLTPYQDPPSASAAANAAHRADAVSTLGSMYSSLYARADPLSQQAPVQSIASWKQTRRRRSDHSTDSDSDSGFAGAVGPAGYAGSALYAGPVRGMPKSRINSSGHAMPRTKLCDPFAADPEETSYAHRLEMLCRLLKVGTPAYDFKADADGAEGIFSGRITLVRGKNNTGPIVVLPPGIGEVRDVYSKRAAREKAAMSVLNHIQSHMAE